MKAGQLSMKSATTFPRLTSICSSERIIRLISLSASAKVYSLSTNCEIFGGGGFFQLPLCLVGIKVLHVLTNPTPVEMRAIIERRDGRCECFGLTLKDEEAQITTLRDSLGPDFSHQRI